MSLLFISHSSADRPAAEELRARLAEHGFSTESSIFLDFDSTGGIQAGQRWEQTLYRNIRACRAVIVLCSAASMASRWCFMEITHARALGKDLFPVKIEDCVVDAVLTDHQVVDFTKDKEAGYGRLFRGILAAGVDPADVFEWKGDRSPYPGLMSFEQEDAAVFFGRDAEIAEGLDLLNKVRRLADAGLVMVLGGSGSGKSSLVRAGLVPRLRKDVERWIVTDAFRPQDDPAKELACVLGRAFSSHGSSITQDSIYEKIHGAAALRQEPGGPLPAPAAGKSLEAAITQLREFEKSLPQGSVSVEARRFLRLLQASLEGGEAPPDGTIAGPDSNALVDLLSDLRRQSGRDGATVLLVIDQFEEMLGHAEDRSAGFLKLLRTIAEHPSRPAVILATMRSDFLDNFQKHPALAGIRWEPLSIGPMSADGIVQVIEKPAAVAGIELEPGLTQALVADTTTPDALPLLAFTLRELSDNFGHDRLLTVSEYREKLGGLQGAIAKSAEELLKSAQVTPAREDLLRRAFLRMVRITDAGTYARVVARWDDLPSDIHPVLEKFVNARLLVSGQRATGRSIEVAHEALFRSWDRLVQWLAASAEALRLKSDVEAAASEWERKGKDEEYLWSGGRVARARELLASGDLPVSPAGEVFVEASHRAADRRRRDELRRIQIAAAVFSILFVIAAASGVYARKKQAAATVNAREANWQTWQAEGQKFVSVGSARMANWQQWQAEGQRFEARSGERAALEARAAEAEQRRKAQESERIAQDRLEEANLERLRVQLGNVIAQLGQLDREYSAETDPGQRKAMEAERTQLRARATETTQQLEKKIAAAAHFRGDLRVLIDAEMGKLLTERDTRQLAVLQRGINSVLLYPETDLMAVSEADLRAGYEDLLTPGQFQAALRLRLKRGEEAVQLWNESKRLHNVTVSQYLGQIILDGQMILWWKRLIATIPEIGRDDTPASVQTAGLFMYWQRGQGGIRILRDATQKRDWRQLATAIEQARVPGSFPALRKQLETIAAAIRSEIGESPR